MLTLIHYAHFKFALTDLLGSKAAAGLGGRGVQADDVKEVDGLLVRVAEVHADAGLKLAPSCLDHLERGLLHLCEHKV